MKYVIVQITDKARAKAGKEAKKKGMHQRQWLSELIIKSK